MQAITTSLLVVCTAFAAQAGLLPALPSISDLIPGHRNQVPNLGNPRWGNAPDNDIVEPFKIEYSEEVSIYFARSPGDLINQFTLNFHSFFAYSYSEMSETC